MKKLLIIPVLAFLAAGSAAFAASLDVTGAPAMQVGEITGLQCADSAEVLAWGYNDHLNPANVANVRIELTGNTCPAGHHLYATPLDEDGNVIGAAGYVDMVAGTDEYLIQWSTPPNAEQLGGVRIAIDQGF